MYARLAGRLRWYLRALGFHPLVRTVDRLEALTVLGVLVAGLFAIPVAVSAGTVVHDASLRTAEQQAQSRHSVQAVVVAGIGALTELDTPAYVRAQWREGTQMRTESVVGPATIRPGDHMTVWVDNSGKVVSAPLRADDAALTATAAAVSFWISIVTCGALVAYLIRRGLDRARHRAWDRELLVLAHNDDGWANRHN
ncbi:Rv1733c family protein [Mycolicibacterium frederiksbergense]|uniref:Rv1733c family protein n=1 Tax=Mycolicibacterium frederiksbergense TaxID=117567 RepID=UPI0039999C6A